MSDIEPHLMTHNLHEVNARLRSWLNGLVPGQSGLGEVRPALPQQMTGLLAELMRAGQWLKSLPGARDSVLEQEVSEYRRNVERLRQVLPLIQQALLRERARLERERARITVAAEWARGSRQTL